MRTGYKKNREPVASATSPPATNPGTTKSRALHSLQQLTQPVEKPEDEKTDPLLADLTLDEPESTLDNYTSSRRARTQVNRAFFAPTSPLTGKRSPLYRGEPDSNLPATISEIEAVMNASATANEEKRESIFLGELLSLFRQRIHFLASLAIIFLPFFALLHAVLSPQLRTPIGFIHCCLIALCVVARYASRHLKSLFQARLLSLTVYALLSIGVGVITVQLSDNEFDSSFQNQFIAYSSYNEIVLSLLLLPFSLWECLTVITIVFSMMFWAAYWTAPVGLEAFHYSHMLVLTTSAAVVMCVAHFQAALRRQAFNSTFDLAQSAAQMELLSTLDTVTGGFNRHYLERALDIEIARAARFGRPLSIIMFDLDNFKEVNDECGHAAGDEVLREVLSITTATIREIDTAVRYGGDEFVVLLPETSDAAARVIAERLRENARKQLSERFGNDGPEGRVTLSIGVITVELKEPVALQDLLERVDERLYEAKRNGKDQIAAGHIR